jgi:hypothetical protein
LKLDSVHRAVRLICREVVGLQIFEGRCPWQREMTITGCPAGLKRMVGVLCAAEEALSAIGSLRFQW